MVDQQVSGVEQRAVDEREDSGWTFPAHPFWEELEESGWGVPHLRLVTEVKRISLSLQTSSLESLTFCVSCQRGGSVQPKGICRFVWAPGGVARSADESDTVQRRVDSLLRACSYEIPWMMNYLSYPISHHGEFLRDHLAINMVYLPIYHPSIRLSICFQKAHQIVPSTLNVCPAGMLGPVQG